LSEAPRIAVLGAGSVGCFIGGAWAAAGLPVTFVGRPAIAKDVHEHGLKLSDNRGWIAKLAAVDFSCVPEPLSDADIILVTVKSGATADAARDIAEHGRSGALVISFQNGVSKVDILERALGSRFRVARGLVPFNVAYLGHGHFHKGVAGELLAEDRPEFRALAERVQGGPAALRLSGDMLDLAWGKLLINLNNAVNALSGQPLLDELRQRDYRRVVAACQREALKLYRRAGITPARVGPGLPLRLLPSVLDSPDWLFNRLFIKAWKIDDKARSSMSDDLAHGRKTEIDHLNGELVRLAEGLGRDAPVNRRIIALVRAAEDGAPPLSPAALRRAALGGR
jgi:2-dehydropantoate 2-reductase